MRHSAIEVLEPRGHEVLEVGEASRVDEQCAAWEPEVALLDAEMSRRAGVSLVSAIKSHQHAFSTAVIVVTRQLDLDYAEQELRAGAHDFLMEPIRTGELLARIEAAARTKALRDELLAQNRRMELTVHADALTGLYNRRFLLTQLAALISSGRRHGRRLAALMIDVDHFKSLNDSYGHAEGDKVLVAVAQAMQGRLRTEDYLGRLGGEEFLALIADTDDAGAERVAEALRATVAGVRVDVHGESVKVSASVGWALWCEDSAEELLKRADRAMYAAKLSGRDTVRGG